MSEQTTTNGWWDQLPGRGGPDLFKALVAFHKTKPIAVMDSVNPAFNSDYASITSVTTVIHKAAKYGLTVTQLIGTESVTTMLCHESGQFISTETCIIRTRDNVHGWMSGVTYARRAAAAAILGIAYGKDDDGNEAVETQRKAKHSPEFKGGKMKGMFPRLKEGKLDYDQVNAWRIAKDKPKLSEMKKLEADRLVGMLLNEGHQARKDFDAWRKDNE
jgi:hypothetical protein